uniref:C2H2-type domain-containing protein n=1 Tax=Manihot esculenta TaxID=3983 RepID=A0A2C9WGL2_MANES
MDSLFAASWSTTGKRTFSFGCCSSSSCLNHVNQKILERIPTMILLKSMGFAEKNISDVLGDMGNEKMKQNIEETMQHWCSTNNFDTISEESAATPTDRRKKRCTDKGVLKEPMKKKKKMDIKLKRLSELVYPKGSYVCKQCNKVFDDFRALGGHTAAHNRNKKAENAPSEELGIRGGDLNRGSSLAEPAVDNKGKRYECDVCSRRFSTGQALGGHKSYHRKTARGEVQEVSGEGTAPAKDVDLKFDLNAPPNELVWGG